MGSLKYFMEATVPELIAQHHFLELPLPEDLENKLARNSYNPLVKANTENEIAAQADISHHIAHAIDVSVLGSRPPPS